MLYKEIYVDGFKHNCAALIFDKETKIPYYMICSYTSKQTYDQCLSKIQEGEDISAYQLNDVADVDAEHMYLYSQPKSYIGKMARAIDENKCDGVHAIIYSTNSRVIRVSNGDNIVDEVYDWLDNNIESGLLEEWKSYLFNELNFLDLIHKCVGYDLTGKAPSIYVLDPSIDTELIRNIKSEGLRKGFITLPVENVKKVRTDMTFVEIITELVLPYIGEQYCHYNIGEPISPLLQKPIITEKKELHLFPKQQVIAQGFLNAAKANLPYMIFCGGQGLGKTMTSIALSHAITEEVLNRNGQGRIAIMLQGHLLEKWKRQTAEVLEGRNVKYKFYELRTISDVYKLPKKRDGYFNIVIFSKDVAKRSYLVEHNVIYRYPAYKRKNVRDKFINMMNNIRSKEDQNVIVEEITDINSMKLLAIKLEKELKKKVILYLPQLDNDGDIAGYYVATSSKFLKKQYGCSKKAYDFFTKEVPEEIANKFSAEITNERCTLFRSNIINTLVCPDCGNDVYAKPDQMFCEEEDRKYLVSKSKTANKVLLKCNAYIKADGTPLTSLEIQKIKEEKLNYRIVENKYKSVYLDENGDFVTGEALRHLKSGFYNGYTVLIRRCAEKHFGAKIQKGYRCADLGKFMLKKFGRNYFDCCIEDEIHELAQKSNQGELFGNLCRLSRFNIPLTGTLTGGKSSDIFSILFRLSPKKMIDEGFGFDSESKFIEEFGRRKNEVIEYEETFNKSGRKVNKGWREIPGISPKLFDIFLSNFGIFRKIEDLNIPLPTLKEYPKEIEMEEELKENYFDLQNQFKEFFNANKGISIGGSYLNTLIAYPDYPIQEPVVADISHIGPMLVAEPKNMDLANNRLLNKEKVLIDTIARELKEGRRSLVFATYTGEKGVSKRLMEILSKRFKTIELKGSKVKTEKREEWINEMYNLGYEVIITNPKCVATGLDIVQYPTIYFYEMPMSCTTFRQAASRNYRANFIYDESRIYYSYYKDTLQEDMFRLQLSKKKSSLNLEGVFTEDMLSAMSEGGDSISATLNNIIKGKIKLKESELDDYEFADENELENRPEIIDVEVNSTDSKDTVFGGEEEITINDNTSEDLESKENVIDTNVNEPWDLFAVFDTENKENEIKDRPQLKLVDSKEKDNLTTFVVDEDYKKKLKKKKAAPKTGQLGFLLNL